MSKKKEDHKEEPEKEAPALQQRARITEPCFDGSRYLEKGTVVMVTQAGYVPGRYELEDKDVQRAWNQRIKMAEKEALAEK